ncbi:MAG: ABC transporter permease [Clostridiales bacterium]|nr:ABC transporter permease [Clostridiales bacterium]
MEIFTLIKSNFKHKKASIFGVVILMILISLSISTIVSVNKNISNRYNEATEEVKVGDLNFFISDLKNVDEIISNMKNNKVDYISKDPILSIKLSINDISLGSTSFIKKYKKEDFKYKVYDNSSLSFIENPEELKESEAYVPISYQELYKCNVGDIIKINYKDSIKEIKIKGFIEEPFIGSSTMGVKLFYTNEKDFNELYDARIKDEASLLNKKYADIAGAYLVSVFAKEDSNFSDVLLKKELNKESNIVDLSIFSLSKDQSKNYTEMFGKVISSILFAFIFLLFIVVLIVIGHSISTGIEMEYANLGILKAQGFTKSQLRKIYFYQYFIAQLIGMIIGIIISITIIPFICRIFSTLTGLLPSTKIDLLQVLAILGVLLVITSLFIIINTRKIGRISPVVAISGGREQIYFNNSIKIPIKKNCLSIFLALRQILSNKKQYLSSLIIIVILSFFMISVSSLNNIMNEKYFDELFGGILSDVYINYGNSFELKDEVEDKISKISKIEDSFHCNSMYFTVDEEEICGQILDNTDLYKSITEGRTPKYDNEIVVTKIVAELLGKNIGDKVNITYKEETKEFIICGIYQCTNDTGYVFGMSLDGVRRINKDYKVQGLDYVIKDKEKINDIIDLLKKDYGEKLTIKNVIENDDTTEYIMMAVDVINVIIYTLSILFVFIVSIMVCGRMFLKERTEFGIYKAEGFTTNYLRVLFSIRFFIVALLGSGIGFVLNYLLNDKVMNVLLRSLGIFNYETKYNTESVLIPCLLIPISYFIFSYIISYKIKRVSVKELIVE